ncbi:MAG: hypothetical protein A2293_02625 [Elusimicrobia bacterium RIFOXYB2_FULL_49_7]|nr:MAG: hypothetical protein A2293_02625 [Elusimicrobia bacterium RIFOXYB2_FULL_49_7]
MFRDDNLFVTEDLMDNILAERPQRLRKQRYVYSFSPMTGTLIIDLGKPNKMPTHERQLKEKYCPPSHWGWPRSHSQ